jgi:predicted acetyltransferase
MPPCSRTLGAVTGVDVRSAAEGDLDRLIEIHTSAFPDPRGHEERRRNFVANPLGTHEALHVATEAGTIVGHAFLFDLDVWVAGARVRCGAIASVGVAPEARGRGVASALLDALHSRALASGAAFTLLYPFRQAFYAARGYANVTPSQRLHLHPSSIPSAWRRTPGITTRRASGDRDAIEAAYARAAARTTGWLVRPKALWDRALADERRAWIVAERGERTGAIAGYVTWSLVQREAHAATRLAVHELCADDDATRRALFGAISAMRDQVIEVEMETDARDPLPRALVDADRARFGDAKVEHALGAIVGGPMVRVTDVARAIATRGIAPGPELSVAIDGTAFPLGAGPASGPPAIATDRSTFGALLFGGLSVTDACALGMAHAADDRARALADAALAHPPFFALDTF